MSKEDKFWAIYIVIILALCIALISLAYFDREETKTKKITFECYSSGGKWICEKDNEVSS